jgi:hypothetical protein
MKLVFSLLVPLMLSAPAIAQSQLGSQLSDTCKYMHGDFDGIRFWNHSNLVSYQKEDIAKITLQPNNQGIKLESRGTINFRVEVNFSNNMMEYDGAGILPSYSIKTCDKSGNCGLELMKTLELTRFIQKNLSGSQEMVQEKGAAAQCLFDRLLNWKLRGLNE